MNKTVTINISGIIFHIEEDAYEKLSKYLSTIRGYFSNADGRDEIMADIEARIAELLKEKTNSVKQVVVMTDVDHVVSIMGKPEDYAGDSEHSTEDKNVEEPFVSSTGRRRRVFRDGDSKILGGVCSGVANYFDIDALWIRLALVVMFFGFGTGFILYIILWIIIPEAKTTAEKLEMRGERIDINNISKTVKEEAEHFKTRAKDFGNEARQTMSRQRDNTDKFVDLLRQVFGTIFNVLGRILGFFLLGIGILFFIALIGSFFGITKIDDASTSDVMSSFYNDSTQHFWLLLGVTFFIGIPAIMFMYKGVKMMFRFKYHNRWLNLSAGILWLVGLITCMIIGINIGQEFSEDAKSKEAFTVKNAKMDTLIIKLNTSDKQLNDELNEVIKGKRNGRNFIHVNRKRWMVREIGQRKMWIGSPEIEIITGEVDSIEVNIIKSACGVDRKTAFERAKSISYHIKQQDSILILDSYFEIAAQDKWRDQEVFIQIKLPKNKVVYLDRSMEGFLNGADNITDTYEGDMLGRRWKMTSKGLACIDCEGLEDNSDDDDEMGIRIPPMPPTPFDIDTKDAKVKIDEHGINIKSKEANVKIDEKGINIETKEDKK